MARREVLPASAFEPLSTVFCSPDMATLGGAIHESPVFELEDGDSIADLLLLHLVRPHLVEPEGAMVARG